MSALTDYNKAAALMADQVTKNLTPIPKDQLPTKELYHVSTNHQIKSFIPQVSKRTMDGEDVRVPRICTAGDLMACLLGYGNIWSDYYDPENKDGWQIYGFDFELAFKPTKRLLPDQRETNELWLITYSPTTTEYKPTRLGKLQLVQYASTRLKTHCVFKLGFLVECKVPVWITEDLQVPAGKHYVVVDQWKNNRETDLAKVEVKTEPVDAETYDKILAGKIRILDQLTPHSAKW